jgi:hypothetical protein
MILNVNNQLLVIEKEVIVQKSGYFAALIDGPLAKPLDQHGALNVADQQDVETFKNLIYIMRNSELPPSLKDKAKVGLLKEMASFYCVDFPFTIEPRVYIYESKDTFSQSEFQSIFQYASLLKKETGSSDNPSSWKAKPLRTIAINSKAGKKVLSLICELFISNYIADVFLCTNHCGQNPNTSKVNIIVTSHLPPTLLAAKLRSFDALFRLVEPTTPTVATQTDVAP